MKTIYTVRDFRGEGLKFNNHMGLPSRLCIDYTKALLCKNSSDGKTSLQRHMPPEQLPVPDTLYSRIPSEAVLSRFPTD